MLLRGLRTGPLALGALALIAFTVGRPAGVSAQAWLPGKGRGTVSISYRSFQAKDHVDPQGRKLDIGRVRSNVFYMDLKYGITRKLAVDLGVPVSFAKYTGAFPHPGLVKNIDDGTYHSGFQDFRFGARYALVRGSPFVITPFVDTVVPSHQYETYAHSAIGRNLRELLIGANVGWQVEEGPLSNAYIQTRISYGFVERVLGRSHNRTNIDTELGYFLTPRFGLSGIAAFAGHHGGLDWDTNKPITEQWTAEEIRSHDQLIRNNTLDVGGGVSFLVNGKTSVYATLLRSVWIINDKIHTSFTVGINWRFRTRRPSPAVFPEDSQEESLPPVQERR